MTENNAKGSPQELPKRAETRIQESDYLQRALTEIICSESSQKLALFRETLMGILSEFDPSSVSMSSTNIPDAILKLSAVLTETSEASTKVFDLIESHQKISKKGEELLAELERCAQQQGSLDVTTVAAFVSKFRVLNHAMHAVSHDIVLSQEFQDLCGQKIKKVLRLVCDVECYLRALLDQLHIDLPSGKSAAEIEADQSVDQESTDQLLKELGL
jgi:chemotaxis regulatin CheY-phosphate phosphatase CheZ